MPNLEMAVAQICCLLLIVFLKRVDGQACPSTGFSCVSNCNAAGVVPTFTCPIGQVCCLDPFIIPTTTMPPCTFAGISCVANSNCNPTGIVATRQCPSGQVCCVDALTLPTTTTLATTTLQPCTDAGISCIVTSSCNSVGIITSRQCPSGQVCCVDALTLATTTLATTTLATTTLQPCTDTGISCVVTSNCNSFGIIPGRQCPSGQVCCVDALTIATTTLATTTLAATTLATTTLATTTLATTTLATTTLQPCTDTGISCVVTSNCNSFGIIPGRQCPSGQVCCVDALTIATTTLATTTLAATTLATTTLATTTLATTTLATTTLQPCTDTGISCVVTSNCNSFGIIPGRQCPSGQVCCVDALTLATTTLATTTVAATTVATTTLATTTLATTTLATTTLQPCTDTGISCIVTSNCNSFGIIPGRQCPSGQVCCADALTLATTTLATTTLAATTVATTTLATTTLQPCTDAGISCIVTSNCNSIGIIPGRQCPSGQVCCADALTLATTTLATTTLAATTVATTTLATTTLATTTLATTTLQPCTDAGISCIVTSNCNSFGIIPGRQCPSGQVCCADALTLATTTLATTTLAATTVATTTLATTTLATTTLATTTLQPCTDAGISCIVTSNCNSFGIIPGRQCPSGQVCCADALTLATTTLATTTLAATTVATTTLATTTLATTTLATTTLQPCTDAGISCIVTSNCNSFGIIPGRQCPSGQVCCADALTLATTTLATTTLAATTVATTTLATTTLATTTLATTTLQPCTDAGISCIVTSTCNSIGIIPGRQCPSGQVCCADALTLATTTLATTTLAATTVATTTLATTTLATTTLATTTLQPCTDAGISCIVTSNCNSIGIITGRQCPSGQVCCADALTLATTTLATTTLAATTVATTTLATTTLATTTLATTTLQPCTDAGISCIVTSNCNSIGIITGRQCPSGQVCCADALTLATTTLATTTLAATTVATTTLATTTLQPCTDAGISCIVTSNCNSFGIIPGRQCPSGQVCCADALTLATTTLATTTLAATTVATTTLATTTLQPCTDAGISCIVTSNCNSIGIIPGRQCPSGQVCCADALTLATTTLATTTLAATTVATTTLATTTLATTTLATTTLQPCTDAGISCIVTSNCNSFGIIPGRQCPSGQVCCADALTLATTTLATTTLAATTVATTTLATTTVATTTLATTTLQPCTDAGISCIVTSNCNSFGIIPGRQCPSGQVCCADALTLATTTLATTTIATTTLQPCTVTGISCVGTSRCPFAAVINARECPSGQVCCVSSLVT
ncbi:mucin-22-like [Haliotis rufescens]|uniref:mucin-22-like n=1 Tax=Haliotis rufescens TaxID=6454 RepID=UPI00201F4D4E|nr:mucin-22-like [Haliotis rufescens]